MSGKYVHKRRETIQPSFPNNKLSTRPRKKRVEKREWVGDDLTIYNRIPDSALFTPYDQPNPTNHAPLFSDYWLRAGEQGDGQEQAQELLGGGCAQHGGVLTFPAQPISGTEIGRPCGIGDSQGVRGRGCFEETAQVATQSSWGAPLITSSDNDGLEDGVEKNFLKSNMVMIDSDSDNLADGDNVTNGTISWLGENAYGTDPLNPDTDSDGLKDGTEVGITWDFAVSTGVYVWDADNGTTTTDPLATDTDGDKLPDGYIDLNGNGTIDLGEFEDFDCDGAVRTDSVWDVSQLYPSQLFFNETDPNKADTDGDSLSDWDEIMTYGINPLEDGDSDGDGLGDFEELGLGTDPQNPDTDGDNILDGIEVHGWYTTINGASTRVNSSALLNDTDGDSIWDYTEWLGADGFAPGTAGDTLDSTDPYSNDTDADGLLDSVETDTGVYVSESDTGTDPRTNDTDTDGLDDGIEVEGWYTFKIDFRLDDDGQEWHVCGDPLSDLDRDGDNLNDTQEYLYGSDPGNPDTDGDNILDDVDISMYEDPLIVDYIGPDILVPELSEEMVYSWWGLISPIMIVEHVWVTVSTGVNDLAGVDFVNASVLGEEENYTLTRDAYGIWSGSFGIGFTGQYVTGYKVVVTARDINQNFNQTVQYGGALEQISAAMSKFMMFTTVPYYNGAIAGTFQGFAGALFSEVDFLLHITEILDMLGEISEAIGALWDGGWDGFMEMVNATLTDFDDLTERINPYPDSGFFLSMHNQFSWGFKQGYIGGIVAEMIFVAWITAGIGDALGLSEKIARVVELISSKASVVASSIIRFLHAGELVDKALNAMRWLRSGILRITGVVSDVAESVMLRVNLLIETAFSSGHSFGSMVRAMKLAARASVSWSNDGIRGLSSYILRNGATKGDDLVRVLGENADDVFRIASKSSVELGDDALLTLEELLADGRVSATEWSDDALRGLGKAMSHNLDDVTKVFASYSDEVAESTMKGVGRGVIDVKEVDIDDLAKHIDDFNNRNPGVDIFSDDAGSDQLIRMWRSSDPQQKIVYLDAGDLKSGDIHLDGRHIDGSIPGKSGQTTSFWPCGEEVRPGIFSPDVMSKEEVLNLIDESIRYGTRQQSGGVILYEWAPNSYGISNMRTVVTTEGRFITSYPLDGSNVLTIVD